MTTAISARGHEAEPRLSHFPVSFFSVVMGLAGLSIALEKAGSTIPALQVVGHTVLALAGSLFVLLALIYGAKMLLHPQAVREEFAHPVRLHFVPTIAISLILLSIASLDLSRDLAAGLLLVGAPLQLALTLLVLDRWINREHFQTPHLNPAWFIPIVGNMLVPIAGVSLGYREASWLFFAVGIVFWLPLFAIVLNRIVFHQPLPDRLRPTLFILIAPPAVGCLAYLKLAGGIDAFARILYFFGLFLTLLLLTQLPRLGRIAFYLSWWAYSFPLAAITVASFAMAEQTGISGYRQIGFVLLTLTSLLIAGLLLRTGIAVARRQICQPE
jgi:tellurite resistance protein